ncbi:MAG: hypothetical protein QOH84_3892 [Kribbellaceae bacterium]|jgi:hypothetical protein|nr:hypothetical protein [Kribbellaceae bacterium]
MTDLLKDTLTERADRAQPLPLDLDAIISTGDRRLRRRRVVAIAGTAMVTLAVLITGLTLIRPATDQPAPASIPFTERRATYAVGSEIHFGRDVISIGPKKVNALVQTDSGFVFTAAGEPGLFLANGKQVRRIGTGPGNGALTVAGDGNLVGWVETFEDRNESVVYDVAAGRELVRTPIGNQRGPLFDPVDQPRIIAIDGDFAYLGTFRGVYRWDLKTGQAQTVGKNISPDAIRTVVNIRHLYQVPLIAPDDGTSLALADNPSDGTGRPYPGQQGWLSPTADYLLTAPNDPQHITPPPAALRLFQTDTGKELTLSHPGHPRLIFSQWLTNDTFTAAGLRTTAPNSPVDLLTCSLNSLTCQTTTPAISTLTFTETPTGTTATFTLPIGTPIYRQNG